MTGEAKLSVLAFLWSEFKKVDMSLSTLEVKWSDELMQGAGGTSSWQAKVWLAELTISDILHHMSGQWPREGSVCKAHRDYGKERAREITGHLVSQITCKADASTTANTTFGHYFYKAYLPSALSLISEDLVKHAFVMLCFWRSCFLFLYLLLFPYFFNF